MVNFLYPYAFFLLVFIVLFFRKKTQEVDINPKLIANKTNVKYKKYFLLLAYILFVVALARPVTDKKEISTSMNIKKAVCVLDISRSMLADDVYPNRLSFAKEKIKQFIDDFNGEIALMAFSDTAFLISPYTTDKSTLKYLLDNINTKYVTRKGTDFQNLIKTAKKMGYKDLVIFTDGGDVKYLDTEGLNLYVLLIGTKEGAPIKLPNGELYKHNNKIVIVGINQKILNYSKFGEIATTGDSDIKKLISQNFHEVKSTKKIVVYKELFIYPLALGLVFLFMNFFSIRLKKEVAMFFILFMGLQLKAFSLMDWKYLDDAKEAYNKGYYLKSALLYSKVKNPKAQYDAANAFYKLKQYKRALDIYKSIETNDKNFQEKLFYNEGNCYAKMKKIDDAIKSYKQALKIDPKDKDARYNLELLEKMKKQTKNKQNKNKNSKSHQNKQKKKNSNKNKNNSKQKKNDEKSDMRNKRDNKHHKDEEHNKQNQQSKNKLKAIKIKEKMNAGLFNKIKTQTLMIPLSKGDSKDEW